VKKSTAGLRAVGAVVLVAALATTAACDTSTNSRARFALTANTICKKYNALRDEGRFSLRVLLVPHSRDDILRSSVYRETLLRMANLARREADELARVTAPSESFDHWRAALRGLRSSQRRFELQAHLVRQRDWRKLLKRRFPRDLRSAESVVRILKNMGLSSCAMTSRAN
jgi:hypothetical protein